MTKDLHLYPKKIRFNEPSTTTSLPSTHKKIRKSSQNDKNLPSTQKKIIIKQKNK